jgi:hypothetical protein
LSVKCDRSVDSFFYIFKHFLNVFDSLTRKLIRPFYLKHAYSVISWGPSMSWSYGSCKSNDLCNKLLSPLTLWVRIPLGRGVLDITLCYKVCQWLTTGRWFSPGSPVSSTNKTDRHDITEILLKVALNTINLNLNQTSVIY